MSSTIRTKALQLEEELKLALLSGQPIDGTIIKRIRADMISLQATCPEHHYRWYNRFDYEDAYRCTHCLKPKPASD